MANEFIIRKGFISKSASTVQSDFTVLGNTTSNSFIVDGGNSSQFLKADGTLDSSIYATQTWVSNNFDDYNSWNLSVDSNPSVSVTSGTTINLIGGDSIDLSLVGNDLTFNSTGTPTGLEAIDEGVGVGWRLIGRNPDFFGTIGVNAVDFSTSISNSSTRGATGLNSFAKGDRTIASGQNSSAEGITTNASGPNSHAEGITTAASGIGSHSEGTYNIASGQASHAEGNENKARAFGEHSGGVYGTDYTPVNGATTSHPTDRLFNLGNGTGVPVSDRDDAFTIYKNGAVRFYRTTTSDITNTNKEGLLIYDSDSSNRPTIHNGTDWKQLAYVGDVANFTETDPTVPSHVKNITTTNISNWDTTYNDKINTITVTGDANKVITLTQQDGTTLTANFEDNNDGSGTDIKINALDFNNTNGILTATRDDAVTVTTDLDGRYSLIGHTHTVSDITDFPTNVSYFNNDAGYITSFTDSYTDGVDFNTGNGILSISRNNGLSNVTVDLDGRYIDLTTNQSISGVKTFADDILLNNSTYLQAKKSSGTNTRIHGINGSDIEYIGSIDSVVSSTLIGNNTNTVKFRVNNTDRMEILSNGNVGIGTTSPSSKLEIEQSNSSSETILLSNSYNNRGFRTGNTGLATFSGYQNNNDLNSGSSYGSLIGLNTFYDGTNTYNINQFVDSSSILFINGNIRFRTNELSSIGNFTPNERMIISKNGNVGINTNNPQTKLHVEGNNPSSLPPLGTAGSAATIGQFSYGTHFSTLSSGRGHIQQGRTDGSTSVYDLLLQPQGGNVGIGVTSADEKLVVNGNIRMGVNQFLKAGNTWIRNNGTIAVISNQGSGVMLFRPDGDGSGNGEMTLTQSGNLEVNGTIKASGLNIDGESNVDYNIIRYTRSDNSQPASFIYDGSGGFIFDTQTAIYNFTDNNGLTITNGDIRIDAGNNGEGTLSIYGSNQSTGRVYVGQDNSYGGGIEYNGDGTPITTGAGSDYITLWRRENGTDEWTARNKFNNNDWEFRNDIYASIFYDTKNTGYFINPSQDSTIRDITTNNTRAFTFFPTTGTSTYLKLGSTTNSLVVNGDIVAFASSDKRLKKNIKNIDKPLDIISKIGGYRFEWNQKSHKETNKKDIGVIAQEIEAFLPEIVQTRSNGYKAVDYDKLTALLIEGMKEQQKNINKQEDRLNNLENRLKLLEK